VAAGTAGDAGTENVDAPQTAIFKPKLIEQACLINVLWALCYRDRGLASSLRRSFPKEEAHRRKHNGDLRRGPWLRATRETAMAAPGVTVSL
jgi:hypothetical protein